MNRPMPAHFWGRLESEPSKTESRLTRRLHLAWRVSLLLTVATGLFHLLNLVGPGRLMVGPAMVTPFRFFFVISWIILAARLAGERRLPRLDRTDLLVAAVAAIFLFRGAFDPQTLGIVVNWVGTGAGVYFLIRFGLRNVADLKILLAGITVAALVLAAFGLIEYAAKSNPLFDAIQIQVIGSDRLIEASSQFYRIRSLIGHPGFVGAILLGVMPLTLLVFWRRRLMMALSLAMMTAALFLTFSRGSWLIGALVLLPLLLIRARYWVRRNIKWIVPAVLIPAAVIGFNYWDRERVSIDMNGYQLRESGLYWTLGNDGPVISVKGKSAGIQPLNHYIYFKVDNSFFYNDHGPLTITINYLNKGNGLIRCDYDSWDGIYKQTPAINKTDSRQWTTAAFYLPDPRFAGRMNGGADFRIVEQDNEFTVDHVSVQKGKLGFVSLVIDQWLSRPDSISNRLNLYPLTWSVLQTHPFGVGLYNSPGTDHHAVDSLPLTWMMEFGWPGLLLVAGLALLFGLEGVKVWREPRGVAAVLYMSLLVLMLHGWHLMILDDKPTLVLVAAVGAAYASVRPWRQGRATINVTNEDCML